MKNASIICIIIIQLMVHVLFFEWLYNLILNLFVIKILFVK